MSCDMRGRFKCEMVPSELCELEIVLVTPDSESDVSGSALPEGALAAHEAERPALARSEVSSCSNGNG